MIMEILIIIFRIIKVKMKKIMVIKLVDIKVIL